MAHTANELFPQSLFLPQYTFSSYWHIFLTYFFQCLYWKCNYVLADNKDSPTTDPFLGLETMSGAKSYPGRVKWDYMELIYSSISFNFIFFPLSICSFTFLTFFLSPLIREAKGCKISISYQINFCGMNTNP